MCLPVDSKIEPHKLSELGITVAQHVSEVMGPVKVGVDGSNTAAFTIQVAVDLGGNAGQLGNQIHGIFIDKLRKAEKHMQPNNCGNLLLCVLCVLM